MACDPVHELSIRYLHIGQQSGLDAGLVGYALLAAASYVSHQLGREDRDEFVRMAADAFDAGLDLRNRLAANDEK